MLRADADFQHREHRGHREEQTQRQTFFDRMNRKHRMKTID
jgi:hypothetical protein